MKLILLATILAAFLHATLPASVSAQNVSDVGKEEDGLSVPENYPYHIEWIPGTHIGLIPVKAKRKTRGRADMYYLSTGKVSHSRAAIYCLTTGRVLVAIKNDLIQEDVEQLLIDRNVRGNIWLSGLCYKDVWRWADLAPIDGAFNKLPRGNVKCNTSQNLVMFGPTANANLRFNWRPALGTNNHYFVCHKN